ncbi:hypothetical protein HYC85_017432 [Camellia sinensis]|uniref:non-specific serine/threonine protein kinase n=1 Tax=Camellia sinensis TaxID=4442 RepID=A0A7J7GT46_CAMSI|nr:hypothetical protein HYC85_017432 [Camellia sinensis]
MYPDSNKDEKNILDSVGFVVVLKEFMNKLSDRAAFNPSNFMFATGKTKITMNETIYGLVQCTRDISRSNCRVCLNSEFGDLDGCCDYRQGGTVLSRNCNMRFQLYPFYNEPTVNDSEKRAKLHWDIRLNIILGIARALLYLHEDSRLKIIHRDLKPNNVLLDQEMVAEISDFGMARSFGENQNIANTKRVVGT